MRLIGAAVAITLMPACAVAQTASSCDSIITRGLYDYNISAESSSYLNVVFSQYCYSDGRSNSSTFNAGLDAVVKAVPVKFTLGSSDASTAMTNFCKTYHGSTEASQSASSYQQTIVRRAYDSYDACIIAADLGFYITNDFVSQDKAHIFLRAGVGRPIEITGIDTTANVKCEGPDGKGGRVAYSVAQDVKSDTAVNIFCTRESRTGLGGLKVFDEGSVEVAIAGAKYNVYWPKSEQLGDNDTAHLYEDLRKIREDLYSTKSELVGKMNNLPNWSNAAQSFHYNTASEASTMEGKFNIYARCDPGQYMTGLWSVADRMHGWNWGYKVECNTLVQQH